MKKSVIIILTIVMLISTGCTKPSTVSQNEIYIPILADEAWLSSDGAFLNGVNLAATDYTDDLAAMGYTIRIEVINDSAAYEKGVELASAVAEEPTVTAVFNLQNFDVSKTTASILSDGDKVTVFPYGAYDSLFSQNNEKVFCGVAAFSDLGKAMGDYAINGGYKRIAVYHNGIQSQEELVTAFEAALINTDSKVVDFVPQIASESDFDQIAKRWQALDVDCVVIAQYGLDEAFGVLSRIKSTFPEMMVIGEPIFNRANALAVYGELAEGMVVPTTQVVIESDRLEAFKQDYEAIYNEPADIWSMQGYDMTAMLIDAVINTKTTNSDTISDYLHENSFEGVSGSLKFNEGGALDVDTGALKMLKCVNGLFK